MEARAEVITGVFVSGSETELAARPIGFSRGDLIEQLDGGLAGIFVQWAGGISGSNSVAKALDGFRKSAAVLHQATEFLPGFGAMRVDGCGATIRFFGQRPVAGAALQISFLHELQRGFFD